MENEVWRKVEEYPEYEISNMNGWRNIHRQKQPKGHISKKYRYVSVGKDKTQEYHILVAKAFPEICGQWYQGCHIHHKNHDTLDNRPENLEVISASEHSRMHYDGQPDSFKKPSLKRSASISAALKGRRAVEKHIPVECLLNGVVEKKYECISDVTKDGYSAGNICMCCKGKIKTAYGYVWQYAVK